MINIIDHYPCDLYWGDSYAHSRLKLNGECKQRQLIDTGVWRQKFIYSYTFFRSSESEMDRWISWNEEKNYIPSLRLICLMPLLCYFICFSFYIMSICIHRTHNKSCNESWNGEVEHCQMFNTYSLQSHKILMKMHVKINEWVLSIRHIYRLKLWLNCMFEYAGIIMILFCWFCWKYQCSLRILCI